MDLCDYYQRYDDHSCTRTPRTVTLFTPLTLLALPTRITYIEFMSKQRSLSQTTNVCLPTSTTGRTHIPFPPRTRPDMHHASSACSGQSRQRRHRRSLSPPSLPTHFPSPGHLRKQFTLCHIVIVHHVFIRVRLPLNRHHLAPTLRPSGAPQGTRR